MPKDKRARYRTTRDLVIPAGTTLFPPPAHSTAWGRDYDAPIGIDKDHTGSFHLDISEGLDAGFLEKIDE